MVAADPARPGTYSLAVSNSTATEFLVLLTHDSGATWSQVPTVVTDDPNTRKFKSWMSYSPHGVLGLAWRSISPDADVANVTATSAHGDSSEEAEASASSSTEYNVFAAISLDEGETFSDPLKISTRESPSPDPNMLFGTDDTSFINLDNEDAFVAWGDWRPGDVSGFFSAVKLHAFCVSDEGRRSGGLARCDRRPTPLSH